MIEIIINQPVQPATLNFGSFSDWAGVFCQILLVIIAFKGLSAWKKELKSKVIEEGISSTRRFHKALRDYITFIASTLRQKPCFSTLAAGIYNFDENKMGYIDSPPGKKVKLYLELQTMMHEAQWDYRLSTFPRGPYVTPEMIDLEEWGNKFCEHLKGTQQIENVEGYICELMKRNDRVQDKIKRELGHNFNS